jgi:hypothetical protein
MRVRPYSRLVHEPSHFGTTLHDECLFANGVARDRTDVPEPFQTQVGFVAIFELHYMDALSTQYMAAPETEISGRPHDKLLVCLSGEARRVKGLRGEVLFSYRMFLVFVS